MQDLSNIFEDLCTVTRCSPIAMKGLALYHGQFIQKSSAITPTALLFAIVMTFKSAGKKIVEVWSDVARVAVPRRDVSRLLWMSRKAGCGQSTTLSFTASSNSFQLAIAVEVATSGIGHRAAFAAVIGLLVEVPVSMGLMNVRLRSRCTWFREETTGAPGLEGAR